MRRGIAASAAILLSGALGPSAGALGPSAGAEDARPSSFTRSRTLDGHLGFETATRVYRRPDGTGPAVALVGVVHVGDRAYYERLVEELGRSEIVLYESVLPRGAFGTGGHDDESRRRSTQDAMLFLRGALERFAKSTGLAPESLSELRAFVVGRDTRLARPLDLAAIDGWGRALGYERVGTDDWRLASLGADGRPGGRGPALDLVLGARADELAARRAETPREKAEDGRDLYKELADALGVSLQVRSIDYDRPGWEPADLPMEELLDRLWQRGERSMTLEMLANSSGLQQGLVRFLLSMVSSSPEFKKVVIRALGQAGEAAGAGRGGLGEVDARLIIDERNDAVIDLLRGLLQEPDPPSSIAIFYGAAHMADFEETLREEFGLAPEEVRWDLAMGVEEWSRTRIVERIARFEEALAAVLAGDPLGAFPEAARLEVRLAALRERLARVPAGGGRESAPPLSSPRD